MEDLVITFSKERETKNTIRFSEDGVENIIGVLYVSKRIANGAQKVTVTLKVE